MNLVHEMAEDDVTFKKIIDHYNSSDKKEQEHVADIITGNSKATLDQIKRELSETGYKDIKELEKEIFVNTLYELCSNGVLKPFSIDEDLSEDSVLITKEDLKSLYEAKKKKPSVGLSKEKKSAVVKKAEKGEDIGKKGKGFEKVADKAAKEYGSKEAGEKWLQRLCGRV